MNGISSTPRRIIVEAIAPEEGDVIVDGTFLDRRVRDDFRRLARQLEVPFVILDCVADLRELRRRLLARESDGLDASEADVGVMEQQRKKPR